MGVELSNIFETLQCWCGLPVVVGSGLKRAYEEKRLEVYCPLGHTFVTTGRSPQELLVEKSAELERTKTTLYEANKLLNMRDDTIHQLKEKIENLKKKPVKRTNQKRSKK